MKLGLIAALSTIAGALAFASFTQTPDADAGEPCKRTEFKTQMAHDACQIDQKAAKDAMKAFNKEHDIKSCNQCHSKLAPNYELKPDGLDQFVKLGGKLYDAKAGGGGKGGGKGTGGGGGGGTGGGGSGSGKTK